MGWDGVGWDGVGWGGIEDVHCTYISNARGREMLVKTNKLADKLTASSCSGGRIQCRS